MLPRRPLLRLALASAASPARAQSETDLQTLVQDEFDRLARQGRLAATPGGADIGPAVRSVIPTGVSLRAAAGVLRSLGFKLQRDGNTLKASSRNLVRSDAFGVANEVSVILGLAGAGDDPTVTTVSARLLVSPL